MGIHPPAADLVPARLREIGAAETGKNRADNHQGSAESGAFPDKIIAPDIVSVDFIGLEHIAALFLAGDLDPHPFQKYDQVAYVQDFRNIGNSDLIISKKHGTYHLKRLILRSLRADDSAELVPAFNDKRTHNVADLHMLHFRMKCHTEFFIYRLHCHRLNGKDF